MECVLKMMEIIPPSYESATARDAWAIIAQYIPSSDLCAATLVCQRWHELFMPFLWGDPASHFGTDNDAVYVALTRFRRTLKYARLEVRMLTHTLHLPPALSEIYGGPRPGWLGEILEYLPCLQSLMLSNLPFFDHNAMAALKGSTNSVDSRTYNIRLLLAANEPNTTSQGLAETLLRFQELVYLDLSYTKPARDHTVLSALSQLEHLQVLKLRAIGLKDSHAESLANAIGIRVRFLDLRDNMLSDMAVRSLLQASFLPPDIPSTDDGTRGGTARTPHAMFGDGPTLANSGDLLKHSDVDEQLMKILTCPLTGLSWIEDLPHVGITHLFIADNQITVEGVAGLLASARLHVLDVGTVDTVESLIKGPANLSSPDDEDPQGLPGAEKLIPILGSSARENMTYLRAHHAVLTADVPAKDFTSPNAFLPELPDEGTQTPPETAELDATDEVHELPAGTECVFELADTSVPVPTSSPSVSKNSNPRLTVYDDEPLPGPRRGSVFAPEVVESGDDDTAVAESTGTGISTLTSSHVQNGTMSTSISDYSVFPEAMEPIPRCSSPLPAEDPRAQRIQELIAKRPKNQTLPRRDSSDSNFPFLHPSHLPHLETLVLTDVPSHVPANSRILTSLLRFITACSDEALLAILQAGSDYSLPPGQARILAEQRRSRSLFGLRRLVLEITPTAKLKGPARLTPWKSVGYHHGSWNSSTGDRDSENMWSAAANDFSFFGEEECGIPENDPGKYFPMAALNEKVILIPEDDESTHSRTPDLGSPMSSNFPHPGQQHSQRGRSRPVSTTIAPITADGKISQFPADVPQIDLVAELALFRRTKKVEYEQLLRKHRVRRSTASSLLPPSISSSSLRSISPSPSQTTLTGISAPVLSLATYVEGHWKGEVNIVRNAAPNVRSGVVDMYGNYFEKGYLYP